MTQQKIEKRIRRHNRVRTTIMGSAKRPRLAVFRANQHIYAQIIDDSAHKTLVQASTLEMKKSGAKGGTKTDVAAEVGKMISARAKEKHITEVVFDRGGFQYHGRVKALAEAARQAGLKF